MSVTSGDSIAKRLFAGRAMKGRAKSDLASLLSKVGAAWEDYSFDGYDGSLELFGPGLEPTKELLEALTEAGFERVWLHKPECPPPRGNDCKCVSIRLPEATSKKAYDVELSTALAAVNDPRNPERTAELGKLLEECGVPENAHVGSSAEVFDRKMQIEWAAALAFDMLTDTSSDLLLYMVKINTVDNVLEALKDGGEWPPKDTPPKPPLGPA